MNKFSVAACWPTDRATDIGMILLDRVVVPDLSQVVHRQDHRCIFHLTG